MVQARPLDDETRAIAGAAAVRLGVPAGDAELVRLHSNATVALPSAGLVLRIATSPDAFDRTRGSVRVCGWLAAHGYPCTVPVDAEPWIAFSPPLTARSAPVISWSHG